MRHRPVIAVSAWQHDAEAEGHPVPHHSTHASYVRAVAKTGALPLVVPELDPSEAHAVVDAVDGVVLVGGADIDPAAYGAEAHHLTQPGPASRDAFDLALARACVEGNHPLLAICRGHQVLNVALGGTLVQHLEHHMEVERYNADVHEVKVEPASRLAAVLGADLVGTNSLHHQAIDRVADGLVVVARAGDGTIEAIEAPAAPKVMSVQWHPELLRHRAEHLALFAALLDD